MSPSDITMGIGVKTTGMEFQLLHKFQSARVFDAKQMTFSWNIGSVAVLPVSLVLGRKKGLVTPGQR